MRDSSVAARRRYRVFTFPRVSAMRAVTLEDRLFFHLRTLTTLRCLALGRRDPVTARALGRERALCLDHLAWQVTAQVADRDAA
jgi:hypothetical protein